MSNIRPFQIFILGVFALLGVGALIFLAAYQSSVSQEKLQYGKQVVIWGTLDEFAVKGVLSTITDDIEAFGVVQYEYIDENSFDDMLINAIAEGRSPDLILLSSDKLVNYRTKLLAIPYDSIPFRYYTDTYIDGAEIFALSDGIYAIPFAVDPIVQYWNKDMFASNGLSKAPTSWEDVVNRVVPKITVRNANRDVLQSAVAFGEYRNVTHAKDILMMLALQSGSKMVSETDGGYSVALDTPIEQNSRAPFDATLQFFTGFSNANNPLYSWNRAMPDDKNMFLSGDLGLYYGYGSEYDELAAKNPNLNFDISMVPQGRNATIRRTYGTFYGFAIPKVANNAQGAFAVARTLEDPYYADQLARSLQFSSPRRDVIDAGDNNPVRQVLLDSGLIARGWFDPEPYASDTIFMQMIEDIVSNRLRIGDAVDDAIRRLTLLY